VGLECVEFGDRSWVTAPDWILRSSISEIPAAGGPGPESDPAVASASWRRCGPSHRAGRSTGSGPTSRYVFSVAGWAQSSGCVRVEDEVSSEGGPGIHTRTHRRRNDDDQGSRIKSSNTRGLRKKGMSKSRAAAIFNSPDASSKGGESSGSSQSRKSSGSGSGGNTAQKKAAGRKGGKKSGKS
jgi:hypothetical protein